MGLFISMLKVSLLVVLLLAAGCEPTKEKESRKVIDEKVKRLAELQTKRENRIKQLKAMDAVQLARELEKESEKGVEPFNSMAFTEIVSRGQDMGSKLKPLLTQPDSRSLLGLLALQKIAPTQYQSLDSAFRIRVLTDALKTSKYFDKWGLPHLYWEDAAKVLIAEGKAAEEPLMA